MIDMEKLVKLMMLTTSNFDGEAMNALRMANRILQSEKKTWSEILVTGSSTNEYHRGFKEGYDSAKRQSPPNDPNGLSIQTMLQACLDMTEGNPFQESTFYFVSSLKTYYETHGCLTPRQKEALSRVYRRVVR